MQSVSSPFLRSLNYSHSPKDRVEVWRGGQLLQDNLQIDKGKVSISGGNGQVIRASVTLSVIDPTGELVPNSMSDPLAPFGSELRIKMGMALGQQDEFVNMGWFPIVSVEIDEQSDFRVRPAELDPIWFSKGAVITLEASDRMYNIEIDKFTSRQQPSGATVLAETPKLLDANLPAYGGVTGTITDKSIPNDITYDTDRMKALLDLSKVIDADPYIDPNGLFRYLSRIRTGSVWRLEPGEFSVLRQTKRRISRDGVYNGATETSTADNDRPLQASKYITSGPLTWAGPFGRAPLLHSSPLLTTQASVDAGVITLFNRATELNPQSIPVECVRNPALQWGDQIELPTRDGYVLVTITALNFPFGVETMTMTVTADPFALRGLL